jgi:hypothetical protein
MICSTCGGPLDPAARFCPQCGAPVAAPAASPPPAAYPPPSGGYPPPSAPVAPAAPAPPVPLAAPAAPPAPVWTPPPAGYPQPAKRDRSTTGLRVASALLFFLAAAFTVGGTFPDYYDLGGALTADRQALVSSLGYAAALVFVGLFLLFARSRRSSAAAGAVALVTATAAAALRIGEFGNLSSFDLSAGPGFWVQTVGDVFASVVWILAIVILVVSKARIGADVRSLGPLLTGLLGLVVLIVGEASSRFTLTYGSGFGSDTGLAIPGAFDDFGWRNTMQVLMWCTVVLAIALGTFLFPRLAGGWGLLTGALMVLVLEVLPPLLSTRWAKDAVSFGSDDTLIVGLRAPFAWTVLAFVLLVVGGFLAVIAPDRDRDRA